MEITQRSRFKINTIEVDTMKVDIMEADTDHLHILIKHAPNKSISQIMRKIKSKTIEAFLWSEHPKRLGLSFWREWVYWFPRYFACSVDLIAPETIQKIHLRTRLKSLSISMRLKNTGF